MPTFYPELDVVHAGDNIQRSLVKINSILWDAVGAFSTMTMFPEGAQPHAQDNPRRSLMKINDLLSIAMGMFAGQFGGNGDPNGVITANQSATYVQWDAPGTVWVKLTDGGNTGWAINS